MTGSSDEFRPGEIARARASSSTSVLLFILFATVTFIFLIVFSDRDGYEGDDLNSIVPMFHLDAAKQGALLIYRYEWQPLSYELGAAIFRVTHSPSVIFLLAPIAGTLSLVLLLSIVWRDRASTRAFAASLVSILAIPELVYSGLYYNSTIIGMPFALGALAMLRSQLRASWIFVAGLFAGIAILMRFDFILLLPVLVLTAWKPDRSVARPAIFTLGVVCLLVVAFFAGLVEPDKIFEIYRSSSAEVTANMNMPGWNARTKLGVLSVLFSPVGWALFLLGSPLVIYQALRRNALMMLLWILAILPLAVPLPNLLSVKYALPLAMFLPTYLMQCLSAIETKLPDAFQNWPLRFAALATVLLAFVSFSFVGHPPFVQVGTLAARPIGTHDGSRSYGGYFWQMAAVDRMASKSEDQQAAAQLWNEFLNPTGPDMVLVGGESYFNRGGIGWRHLQLTLEQAGVHGTLVGPHQIQFDLNGRRLTLLHELRPDSLARFNRGRDVKLYDLSDRETPR